MTNTAPKLGEHFQDMLGEARTLSRTTTCGFTRLCIDKVIADYVGTISIAEDVAQSRAKLNDASKILIVDAMHYGDNDELQDYPEEVVAITTKVASNFRAKYESTVPPLEVLLGAEKTVRTNEAQRAYDARKTFFSKVLSPSSGTDNHPLGKLVAG